MSSTEQITEVIWRRIKSAANLDDLRLLLGDIRQHEASGELTSADALSLAHSALKPALDLAREDFRATRSLIYDSVIPLCVRAEADEGIHRKAASSNLRELLAEWIDQWPQATRGEFRDGVLKKICDTLETAPTAQAIWTIGVIGYRDNRVLAVLWPIAERDDALGDAAIGTLAGLGLSGEERHQLTSMFRVRASSGLRFGLLYALQKLAGIELLDFLLALVDASDVRSTLPNDVPFLLLLGILSKIPEHDPDNRALQDRVWQAIRAYPREALSSPEIGGSCDTRATVLDHAKWTIDSAAPNLRPEMRDIQYQRLADLVRPRQLAGWDDIPYEEFLTILRRDASEDTRLTGQYVTTAVRRKVDAFETALALGREEPLNWLDDSVGLESSRHVQDMLLKAAAAFQIEPLPECVVTLVRNEFNATRDQAGELVARAAATRLAQSAGTREAFDLLLQSGLTFDGSVLLTTADALADLSIARIEAGDSDITTRLLDQALHGQAERQRDAAINALCVLASLKKLDASFSHPIVNLIDDNELSEHTRCKAIEALGLLPPASSDELDAFLIRLSETQGEIGFRAMEAIIRRGQQSELEDRFFAERLNLKVADQTYSFAQPEKVSGWQAFLIGLLYQADPARFAPAISGVLLYCESDAAFRVYRSVTQTGLDTPAVIIDAVVGRIRERFRLNSVETSLFDVLASIAPDRLISENWAAEWNSWLPQGRSVLCDAIGTIARMPAEMRGRAIVVLSALALDSTFPVRRAAYRAFSRIDPAALATTCRRWSRSENVELRKRAAEAAAWLSRQLFDDNNIEEIDLSEDQERSVRTIAKDILQSRLRREWAELYLDRVLSVASGSNQAVLSAYRFGRALTKLGDDDTRKRLAFHIASNKLSSNVVYWLNGLIKAIDTRWKQETRKWPEPWFASEGAIEELDGEVILQGGNRYEAHFSLWCLWSASPSEPTGWGGVVHPTAEDVRSMSVAYEGYLKIAIPGRATAQAVVSYQSVSSPPTRQILVIHGSGVYPRPPASHA
jgi:hypothetical protein